MKRVSTAIVYVDEFDGTKHVMEFRGIVNGKVKIERTDAGKRWAITLDDGMGNLHKIYTRTEKSTEEVMESVIKYNLHLFEAGVRPYEPTLLDMFRKAVQNISNDIFKG